MWYEYQYKPSEDKLYRNTDEAEFYATSYWGLPNFDLASGVTANVEEVVLIDGVYCYYSEKEVDKAHAINFFNEQIALDYCRSGSLVTNREYILNNTPDF